MQTKIKSITEKTYQGKHQGYALVLEDGTIGNLAEKFSDTGLKAGDDVIATVKDYLSQAGKHSNLITLKLVQPPAAQMPLKDVLPASKDPLPDKHKDALMYGIIDPVEVRRAKIEATYKSMALVIGAVESNQLPFDKVKDKFKEINQYLWDAIDECCKE